MVKTLVFDGFRPHLVFPAEVFGVTRTAPLCASSFAGSLTVGLVYVDTCLLKVI